MNEILKSVFSGEDLNLETFEKRLSGYGKFKLMAEDELSALEALSGKNAELEKELAETKNGGIIDLTLSLARAKNIAAAKAVLDSFAVYDENGLNGELLSAEIEKMKAANPWLFEDNAPPVTFVSTGRTQGKSYPRDPSRMSDEEYYKNQIKNN